MKKVRGSVLLIAICILTSINTAYAQTEAIKIEDSVKLSRKKLYFGAGMDAAVFSTSIMDKTTAVTQMTPLRFTSYAFNLGFNLNYDFTNNIGVFTGLNFKNIGFTEKLPIVDSTVKRRVLTLGIPVGIKVGNIGRHIFGFAGGGVDFPINYKEKGYIRRGSKDKMNEWFSDRTPHVMPYIFAGVCVKPGVTLKFQYYPGNFLNTGYTEVVSVPATTPAVLYTTAPYASYTKVNLILFSIGFDMRYTKKSKTAPVETTPEMKTM